MLALLSDIVAVMAPVFLIAALGYGWARAELPYSGPFITTFMINVATPCLVFATLLRLRFEADELLRIAGASLACLALAAAVAFTILRLSRQRLRIYLPALIFPNAGNMGMPLCLFAFGEEGLGLAVVFFAVLAVAQFTMGPAIAAGRLDLQQMARTPLVYAVALALLLQLLGLELPRWAANTTRLLGDCAVPLMLLSLGVALARLRIAGLGRAAVMSVLRIAIGFAVGLTVATAFGLEGTIRGVVILESAMPVAVFNYLWAVRYDTAPEEIAGMVLGSTLLSFATLPPLLWAVMPATG
ncbi:MAG: AEC family transporter [Geminicoccaceae bacterium]